MRYLTSLGLIFPFSERDKKSGLVELLGQLCDITGKGALKILALFNPHFFLCKLGVGIKP